MTLVRAAMLSLLAGTALLVAGCGSSGSRLLSRLGSSAPRRATEQQLPELKQGAIPAPAPTGTPADPAAVKVIEGWASALRRGDVRAAAAYFAQPSELLNGNELFTIHTLTQAETAMETLPCGAQFVSATQRGRYVNALFRLTSRLGPGGGGDNCGAGAGETARTNFLVSGGRILAWIRAPDDPGDNGTPTAPFGSGGKTPLV